LKRNQRESAFIRGEFFVSRTKKSKGGTEPPLLLSNVENFRELAHFLPADLLHSGKTPGGTISLPLQQEQILR
jgi:hypothetical protein